MWRYIYTDVRNNITRNQCRKKKSVVIGKKTIAKVSSENVLAKNFDER